MSKKSDSGTIVDATTVRFERVLPGPVDRVWAHLTSPELLASWLAPVAKIDLKVGGHVELHMGHGGKIPDEVKSKLANDKVSPVVKGKVTRLEAGRVLAYTWTDGEPGEQLNDSEVSFELEPRGDDVLLVLTHRRLDAKFIPQVLAGWHVLLDTLDARARAASPPDFMHHFQEVLAQYSANQASVG